MADAEQNEPTLATMAREAAALDEAIARATDELNAISAAASEADRIADDDDGAENCTIHEVMGVGRYAIPAEEGWEALLDIVHDPSVDINYSPNLYPVFDAVIQDITQSPYLDNPDEPKYDSATFRNLRDNIAAVRNYLMETYYANTPEGMSTADAKRSLEEIATFLGQGLNNNLRLGGLIPNHDPTKPFIDLSRASEPDGAGAQYIYEEILKMQRQSDWWRPFAQITALFGGKKPVDWKLPSGTTTPFRETSADVAIKGHMAEAAVAQRLENLYSERDALDAAIENTALAVDMETMGNNLLATADRLNDVSQLSEPVQRNAIEIAKDILRKLKIQIGDKNLIDGLRMSPQDDRQALGGIQGVAMVYERLLAWGRGIDASIAQHPSIMAATQAVGQLGYMAKLESLRVATAIGNTVLADRIAARIAAIPDAYKNVNAANFGDLLSRVEGGIDTVLNRIQAIQGPGAGVGHTPDKQLGSYMNSAPIAGLAMQLSGDGANRDSVGRRNAEVLAAEEAAATAQASRINSMNAERARQQGQQNNQPARSAARGQQAVQQARQQQQRTTTTTTQNLATMTVAQRNALLQRNAALRAHDHDHHDDHAHQPTPQKIDPKLLNPALLNKIKAATSMAGVNTNDMISQKQAFAKMQAASTQGLKPPVTPNLKAQPQAAKKPLSEDEQRKQQLIEQVAPGAPKPGGHGYGR